MRALFTFYSDNNRYVFRLFLLSFSDNSHGFTFIIGFDSCIRDRQNVSKFIRDNFCICRHAGFEFVIGISNLDIDIIFYDTSAIYSNIIYPSDNPAVCCTFVRIGLNYNFLIWLSFCNISLSKRNF